MFDPENHEMELEHTYPTGAEEWCCRSCGRRFLLQWPPKYKKIILEAGDEQARHYGGKGGVSMGPARMMPTGQASHLDGRYIGEETDPSDEHIPDEPPPWLRWLNEYGRDEA